MHPRIFLDEIAHPNMVAARMKPDDMRAVVNAILAFDALAGIVYAHQRAALDPAFASFGQDDQYRDYLSGQSTDFQALRDTAAALKHGELTRGTKVRLVRRPDQMQAVTNGLGLFQIGDRLGHDVIVIELTSGPAVKRADRVIGGSYQLLKPVVDAIP